MDVDFEELAMFIDAVERSDFSYFLYEKNDVRIEVRRGSTEEPAGAASLAAAPPVTAAAPAVATSAPAASPEPTPAPPAAARSAAAEGDIDVTAPLLGTVYLAPKPGEPPFVQEGDRVTAGSPVCIIEVMKLMNSVEAPVDGTVVARHVADAEFVEYGPVLFTIRPDAA